MAEGKYGRLFTEEDVTKLIRAAYEQGWDDRGLWREGSGATYDHVVLSTLLESEDGPWAFPADEPLFLLRGQDRIALGVVAAYYGGTLAHGCPSEHSDAVQEAYERMRAWQTVHADRVKVPD